VRVEPSRTFPHDQSLLWSRFELQLRQRQIVAGTATSGSVTINNTSLAKLLFNYFLVTEHNTYYDHASVQLSVNGGPFTVVASNNQNQGGVVLTDGGSGWEPAEVDLTPYLAGFSSATVQVRFAFDSVDALFNTNTGFLVDDVQIMALNNQPPVVNAGPNQTITLPAGRHSGALHGTTDCRTRPQSSRQLGRRSAVLGR